ncbi:C-3 sterol dehydrogenase [Hysterangium stoloniferum]|nr:C-3 sterol dehydrogenase [Hysterangium stoloniferum]
MESYLVIGGCGFLGRNLVEALLTRGAHVAVFDLVQRHFDTNIQFFTGDITDEESVTVAIQKSHATTIFHTASPTPGLAAQGVYEKVNVEGTKTIISAAMANGVKYLVYTSSAGLLFDGSDLHDVDERLLPPDVAMDAYNGTKAIAEKLVIEANGIRGLKTVAIRPSGIFGPGDSQGVIQISSVVDRGQTNVKIGSNDNLTDWTYVDNVVKGHLLAADKLALPDNRSREEIIGATLPTISLTTGERRIPTSLARPIGPAVERPPNADELERAFREPRATEERSYMRSKYDPLTPEAIEREESDPFQVAGQVFNITNGEPVCFWDFTHAMMLGFGAPQEKTGKWTLPRSVGYVFACATELSNWLTGKAPTFTRLRVEYMCSVRYYNIEKARRILGYEPNVGLKEAIQRTTEWWKKSQQEIADSKQR